MRHSEHMDRVRAIAREIVVTEGGYADDPDDRGGATKHGVSLAYARSIGLDLDQDGDVDAGDIRLVSEPLAVDLFVGGFFRDHRLGMLPEQVWPPVFDFAVHSGPSQAVRSLQHVLKRAGYPVGAIDGIVGPMTGRAALAAVRDGFDLVTEYALHRRDYLYGLADMDPTQRRFVERRDGGKGGWIVRAESFLAEDQRLSAAEHRARLAA